METFATAAAWRAWLDAHAATEAEVVVRFWKTATGRPCMTWSESVDEALCVGWIDGVRRGLDAESYTIRFTPRRASSTWSAVNVAKVAALEAQGRMTDAGRAAFAQRRADRTGTYSHEVPQTFDDAPLRADPAAWMWWQEQAPTYRRQAGHWVTSAKQEAARARRLEQLLADCREGRKVKPLRRAGG